MKKWYKDPIAWLMVVSMLLLVGLGSFWLMRSYNMLEHTARRQADFLFTSAIREVEDSLIEVILGNDLDLLRADSTIVKTKFVLHLDSARRPPHLRSDTLIATRALRRQWRQKRKERSKEEVFGAIGWHLATSQNLHEDANLNKDSIGTQIYHLVDREVRIKFDEADFPGVYQFGVEKRVENSANFIRVYHDIYTEREFQLTVTPSRMKIIKMMSWQLAIVLLTLVFTLLSFLLTYYNLKKQRRLTLLKNDLISNISHELKTPIATVKVALEAIEGFKVGEDAAKRKEYLQISKNEMDRLALLVDNVLKTSISENGLNLEMEIINLKELVESILKTMQLQFEKTGTTINLKSPDKVLIKGDRLHLTSVIYNLIDNAIKYSDEDPIISLELLNQSNYVKFVVSDKGRGIEKEYLAKIFDNFFRVPAGDIHDIKGHGMGLSYVANVVKQHSGSIDVQSTMGKGSKFIITLPGIHEKD